MSKNVCSPICSILLSFTLCVIKSRKILFIMVFKYIGKKYGNLNFYSQCIELLRKIKNHIFKL